MKILIVGSFRFPMYAPAFYNAYKALGHDVIKIDYEDYLLTSKSYISSFVNRVQDRFHYGLGMYSYNKDIVKTVKDFLPDFVFFYRCYHVWPQTVKNIRKKTICISYNNDDPFSGIPSNFYYRHFKSLSILSHINYVYRRKNIKDYERIGAKNIKILLPYYITTSNYYIPCIKSIPLAFIGHYENDGRDKIILELKEAGLPIVVYGGEDWKSSQIYDKISDVIIGKKTGEEYNQTINQIKIALVFLSKINNDTYTRRCFEIPATKTLMLSEYTDDMNSLYPENICAYYFRTPKELIEKVNFLLANPEHIERIAENAYNRLIEIGGSELDRCQQIIADIIEFGQNNIQNRTFNKNTSQ